MKCGRCGGELKEETVVRNRVKIKIKRCPACEKKSTELIQSLQAKRRATTAKDNEELKSVKKGAQRMKARRKL